MAETVTAMHSELCNQCNHGESRLFNSRTSFTQQADAYASRQLSVQSSHLSCRNLATVPKCSGSRCS